MKYLLGLLLAALLPCVPCARAEPTSVDSPEERVSPLERIGTPASPEGVRLALEEARASGEQALTALAFLLGEAGGRAAAEGLALLSDDRSLRVRVAALRAAARLRLRTNDLAEHARSALGSRHLEMRLAALEALGGVGDGRDVPALLDLTASDSADLATAAFRALRKLTGLRIPNSQPRWTYWWRTLESRAAQHLEAVLEAPEDSLDEIPPGQRIALRDLGWLDLPAMEPLLRHWLTCPDQTLRAEACALVAHHRLADLGPDVEQALRFATDESLAARARITLDVLGVPVENRSQAE